MTYDEEKKKKRYARQPDGTYVEIPEQPNIGAQTGKVYPAGVKPGSIRGAVHEATTTARDELAPGIGVLSKAGEVINRAGTRVQQNVTGAIDKTVPAEAFSTEKKGEPMTMERAIPQGVRDAGPKVAENVAIGVQSLPGVEKGLVPSYKRAIENIKGGEYSRAAGNIMATAPRTVAAMAKEGKEHVIDPAVGAVEEAIPFWKQSARGVLAGMTEDPNAPPQKPGGLPYTLPGKEKETEKEKPTDVQAVKPEVAEEVPGHGSSTRTNQARGTITDEKGEVIAAYDPAAPAQAGQEVAAAPEQQPRTGYGLNVPRMQSMETYVEHPGGEAGGGVVRMRPAGQQSGLGDPSQIKTFGDIMRYKAALQKFKTESGASQKKKELGIQEQEAESTAASRTAETEAKRSEQRLSELERQDTERLRSLRLQYEQETDPARKKSLRAQIDAYGDDEDWKPAKVGEDALGNPVYAMVNSRGETRQITMPEDQGSTNLLAHLSPEVQSQAAHIRQQFRSGEMSQEDALKKLNELGIQ